MTPESASGRMTLIHLFDLSLLGRSHDPALESLSPSGDLVSTFGELEIRSNQLAWLLEERGLRTGDRLCVYLRNRSEFIDLYLACLKISMLMKIQLSIVKAELSFFMG